MKFGFEKRCHFRGARKLCVSAGDFPLEGADDAAEMAWQALAHMQDHVEVVRHDDVCGNMDFRGISSEVLYGLPYQLPQRGEDDLRSAAVGGQVPQRGSACGCGNCDHKKARRPVVAEEGAACHARLQGLVIGGVGMGEK